MKLSQLWTASIYSELLNTMNRSKVVALLSRFKWLRSSCSLRPEVSPRSNRKTEVTGLHRALCSTVIHAATVWIGGSGRDPHRWRIPRLPAATKEKKNPFFVTAAHSFFFCMSFLCPVGHCVWFIREEWVIHTTRWEEFDYKTAEEMNGKWRTKRELEAA